MTRIALLEQLREFTKAVTKDIIMPTMMEKGDAAKTERPAEVFLMRLPDSRAAKKKAPYILHQLITGNDEQRSGERAESRAMIRTIFCVYHDNEQEGSLALLNLMERLRIELLRKVVIGNQFQLDLEASLETLVYPDDTAPFFAGEIVSTWKLPAVEREVIL